MKIVFGFDGKHPQVSFTGRPYISGREQPTWRGAHVEGLIIDSTQPDPEKGTPFESGDALYIEGDLTTIRTICQDVLEQLDALEQDFRGQVEDEAARSQLCDVCGGWFDTRFNNEDGHGDGRGLGCLGDGTAYMGNRQIRYARDGQEHEGYVGDLRQGDSFTLREPIGDYEKRTFVALENPIQRRGAAKVRIRRD